MATIPLPLRGRDITLVRLTNQTVNASSGLLSDDTVVGTITAKIDGVEVRDRVATEDFSAITSTAENQVGINQGTEYVLREILNRVASSLPTTGSVLAKFRDTMISGAGIAKIEVTRGGNTWTGYGQYTGYTESLTSKGKMVGEMTFAAVDVGSPNIAYT